MKFSKFYVNIFSFNIVLLIVMIIGLSVFGINKLVELSKKDNNINKENVQSEYQNINPKEIDNWSIKIESINLNQKIVEGTDSKIIINNLGHYTITDNLKNNIVLLGYTYEKDKIKGSLLKLEEVKANDLIDYKINDVLRQYKVRKNIILNKDEINEYIHTYEDKNILKIFGYIKSNDTKIRYVEAVEIN